MSKILPDCAVVVFTFVVAYYGLSWLICKRMKQNLYRKAATKRVVCLTFDDGPGPQIDTELLRILEQSNSKATFFFTGRNVEKYPTLVRQIQSAGHTIGSHGYSHVNHWRASPWKAIRDIRNGWNAIDLALGQYGNTYPFRPPNGKLTLITLAYLRLKRAPVFLWTFDSRDTWVNLPDLVQRIRTFSQISTGVVLLHDFERRDDNRSQYVLETTAHVLQLARQASVRKASVLELS